MGGKKPRDSAAIAKKARITKARKVLKSWADDEVHVELLIPDVCLRVSGTIRQAGDPGDNWFLFLSASREISSVIFLTSWERVTVEQGKPAGTRVYLRSAAGVSERHDLTLAEERSQGSKPSETSAVLKQLGLWVRLQTKLISSFEFPFASSYWTGTIKEYSPGIFALANENANQTHLIDTTRCGRVEIERIKGHTVVTLTSWTGHFQVTISDAPSNIEAAYKRFAMRSTTVH